MPSREYQFWVYILASRSRNLYIGVTNSLLSRTRKHREHLPETHTARYAIDRLVYFEHFTYVNNAIAREKELKHWTRAQKIERIERGNPTWDDLYPRLANPPMTWSEAQLTKTIEPETDILENKS